KQVQETDRDGKKSCEVQDRYEADRGDLAGDLGDANGPSELVGRFTPDDHAAQIGECALDHEPGLFRAELDGGERIDRDGRLRQARNAEQATTMHVAEMILLLGQLGRRAQLDDLPATIDLEFQLLIRSRAHEAL